MERSALQTELMAVQVHIASSMLTCMHGGRMATRLTYEGEVLDGVLFDL
jgi:hypothetical protein